MVNDRPVIAVEPDRTVFDRSSGYRTKPGQTWGPPVWEFAARGRASARPFLRRENDTSRLISRSVLSVLPPRSGGSVGLWMLL
ncbi:hypothetical protein MRF4_13470 [Methylobacterium radiotolerans]